MWEELVGLKSQVSRPNLSASFPCLEEYALIGCWQNKLFFFFFEGGILREWKQGKEADSSQQRGLNVWTKPNGIFRAKECSGVHWGEPTGPGRTWPLSLLFKIVHLVLLFFCCWLIWRIRFECLYCQQLNFLFFFKKDRLDDNSCFSGFQ